MVKVLYIIFVVAVILVGTGGIVFFSGDDILQVYDKVLSKNDFNSEDVEKINDVNGKDFKEAVENGMAGAGGSGGGDSGGGGGDSEETTDKTNCEMRQIQYSLKNFRDNAECVNTGINGCTKLVMNCSVGVYNLDENTDDVFGIRYFLVDSNDEELDFRLIEKNVRVDMPEIFFVEFVRNDISGVDEDLTCSFTIETIPEKEVCS